jgi:MarR family transcriptional regulator for hemolysin
MATRAAPKTSTSTAASSAGKVVAKAPAKSAAKSAVKSETSSAAGAGDDGTAKPAKPTTGKSGEFRLGFLIHDVSRLRRTVVDKALRPLGVTRSQWWVLANLSRQGDGGPDGSGMMQTELAKFLDIGKVALGGLLDRLEANGYIVRIADPADRRAKRIRMTDSGATLLSAIQKRASVLNKEMTEGVTDAEILATEDVLYRMKLRLIEADFKLGETGDDSDPVAAEHSREPAELFD